MYAEDIYTAASAIRGEESDLLRLLSTAAEEELIFRLRSDVDINDISDIFIAAGALLAVSMYNSSSSGTSGVKSFSAGEMSVTYFGDDTQNTSGDSLRETAELLMARYLVDDGFIFRGV